MLSSAKIKHHVANKLLVAILMVQSKALIKKKKKEEFGREAR